jgi:cytidine deaminase
MNDEKLMEKLRLEAIKAREMSYSPYSGFKVGAALLTAEGKMYTGANIENAAFTPTNCAERTAFFKAVSEGERRFSAIAVAGWHKDVKSGYAFPCGVCRQVMMEFCEPDFRILVAASEHEYALRTLSEILPDGFGSFNLK